MFIFEGKKEGFSGMRLDKFLAAQFPAYSRSQFQKMIKNGDVLVNGTVSKSSCILTVNDLVEVKDAFKKEVLIEAENIDLPVVYEDEEFLVINKPAGMVVHPDGCSVTTGTVVNAFFGKIPQGVGEDIRRGIVHRLDKDTSGLLVVVKTLEAKNYFVKQFQGKTIKKVYLALVKGVLPHKEGRIEAPIGRDVQNRKRMAVVDENKGKNAISLYKVLEEFEVSEKFKVSLVEVEIKTGRTHQIRVHMQSIGHPIVGDNVYGSAPINRYFKEAFGLDRQFLHAKDLSFKHLKTGKTLKLEAELPEDLKRVLKEI